jgi:hypothetical protein
MVVAEALQAVCGFATICSVICASSLSFGFRLSFAPTFAFFTPVGLGLLSLA